MASDPRTKFDADELTSFAALLLSRSGLPPERAQAVAEILVEGDLLGHSTHGLQLLSLYLEAIERGMIALNGDPVTISDHGSSLLWDGQWLPGPWLVRSAVDLAFSRSADHPVVTIVIRRAGHIGCLAAYPGHAVARGLIMLLTCSDPSVTSVAPYGGTAGRYTPNPIAAGWPTDTTPVIMDVCASTTTNGAVARAVREGRKLPGLWLVDAGGNPSDDPRLLAGDPPAAIAPLGGPDLGHKGFALGLLVEALTSGLGGKGRADRTEHWGAAVFLQVINPEFFAGRDAFRREAGWLASACETSPPKAGGPAVRLPGSRGLSLRSRQQREGVLLPSSVMPALSDWCARLAVQVPFPIATGEARRSHD